MIATKQEITIMGFVLGFGAIEKQEQAKIKNAIIEAIQAGGSMQAVVDEWNNKAKAFDKMPRETAPERYTRVYYYDKTLHYHHINRRHAFSPDGWALLCVEEPFMVPRDV